MLRQTQNTIILITCTAIYSLSIVFDALIPFATILTLHIKYIKITKNTQSFNINFDIL